MKHKEKECTWAPGMQDTDVTFAGDHAWATIARAQGIKPGEAAISGRLRVVLVAGLVLAVVAAWWFA